MSKGFRRCHGSTMQAAADRYIEIARIDDIGGREYPGMRRSCSPYLPRHYTSTPNPDLVHNSMRLPSGSLI
jgi:hypothetical protein